MGHLIQKQLFSLSVENPNHAHEWEGKLHAMIHQVINPSIEKCFDEIGGKDHDIIIDKIEIDLGILNKLNSSDLENQIKDQLRKQIEKHSSAWVKNTLPYDHIVSDKIQKEDFLQLTPRKKSYLCFTHFLRHGFLPWWVDKGIDFGDEWIAKLSRKEIDEISSLLSAETKNIDRLIFQFPESFLTAFLRHFIADETDIIQQSWNAITKRYDLSSDNGNLHHYFWKFWIEKSIELSTISSRKNLQQAVASWLRNQGTAAAEWITPLSRSNATVHPGQDIIEAEKIPSAVVRLIMYEAIEGNSQLRSSLIKSVHTPMDGSIDEDTLIRSESNDFASIIESEITSITDVSGKSQADAVKETDQRQKLKEIPSDTHAFFVAGAGIVLLHPFLSELFTTAGLWSKTGWASEFSQHQATQLIAYMTFGKTDLPEYQLTLAKVLANIPLAEPLDTRCNLREEQIQLADELMHAVIEHWKAIGNSSIEGLREGFIQREGKLTQKKDNRHLTIENKAQDILLARLPWGISLIHLPWLASTTLHVKWTD